ncbi:MAG: ATP-dependent Clp protease proteolytic subunit, partial [Alphaproteobacteria bacterium]
GDSRELRKTADVLDKHRSQILAIYATRSGREVDELSAMMDEETWLDADEAAALGFVDEAVEPLEPERVEGLAKFDLSVFGKVPDRLAGRTQAPKGGAGTEETEEMAAAAIAGQPAASGATGKDKDKAGDKAGDGGGSPPAGQVDEAGIRAAATKAERERVEAIHGRGRAAKAPQELIDKLVADGASVDQANAAFVDAWAAADTSPEGRPQNGRATVTADARDKFVEGATLALLARTGMAGGERNEFSGMTLQELARESLQVSGRTHRGMDRM